MYKTASRNTQRRLANARAIKKEIPEKGKALPDFKTPKAVKALRKGYEPKRENPAKVSRKLDRRMKNVVVEKQPRLRTNLGGGGVRQQ